MAWIRVSAHMGYSSGSFLKNSVARLRRSTIPRASPQQSLRKEPSVAKGPSLACSGSGHSRRRDFVRISTHVQNQRNQQEESNTISAQHLNSRSMGYLTQGSTIMQGVYHLGR